MSVHPWNSTIWQNLNDSSARSNHALLFSGNAGLGKRELAIELAQHILTKGQTSSQGQSLFNAATHPDFHVLMPEIECAEGSEEIECLAAKRYLENHAGKPKKAITIEQVRKLTQTLTTHPHISDTRVVLVLLAETMNRNSANAILKSLEEPPANTLFVIVSDDAARLTSTIRSRCSVISFRTPEQAIGQAWLQQQKVIPFEEIDSYLSIANGCPLMAITLYKAQHIEQLKTLFSSVNELWANKQNPLSVAKVWQDMGSKISVDVLQKIVVDLIRLSVSSNPNVVFFPIQKNWLAKINQRFSAKRLLLLNDQIIDVKRQLNSSADELLILETLSQQFYRLAE